MFRFSADGAAGCASRVRARDDESPRVLSRLDWWSTEPCGWRNPDLWARHSSVPSSAQSWMPNP